MTIQPTLSRLLAKTENDFLREEMCRIIALIEPLIAELEALVERVRDGG